MLKQLELMVNFNEVIGNHIPTNIEFTNNSILFSFELSENYKYIGDYLHSMCFCHTNLCPMIEFAYESDIPNYLRLDKDIIPQNKVSFNDIYVILEVPMYKHLRIKSVRYSGVGTCPYFKDGEYYR